MQMKSVWGGVAAGALLVTVGCGATQNASAVRAQAAAAAPVSPVVVSCEPHQRTLVRPTMVNGQAVSQVECVAADSQAAAVAAAIAAPAAYQVAQPAAPVVYRDLEPAQVVPVREVYQAPRQPARPVHTRQVVSDMNCPYCSRTRSLFDCAKRRSRLGTMPSHVASHEP